MPQYSGSYWTDLVHDQGAVMAVTTVCIVLLPSELRPGRGRHIARRLQRLEAFLPPRVGCFHAPRQACRLALTRSDVCSPLLPRISWASSFSPALKGEQHFLLRQSGLCSHEEFAGYGVISLESFRLAIGSRFLSTPRAMSTSSAVLG